MLTKKEDVCLCVTCLDTFNLQNHINSEIPNENHCCVNCGKTFNLYFVLGADYQEAKTKAIVQETTGTTQTVAICRACNLDLKINLMKVRSVTVREDEGQCVHCKSTNSALFHIPEYTYLVAKTLHSHAKADCLIPMVFELQGSKIHCAIKDDHYVVFMDGKELYRATSLDDLYAFNNLLIQRLGPVKPASCDHLLVHWIPAPEENLYKLRCFFCNAETNIVAYSKVAQSGPFRINFFPKETEK